MSDTGIFGLRFKSNDRLQPSLEELRLFLADKKPGTRVPHSDDLKAYQEFLAGLDSFKGDPARLSLSDKMLYTVLEHSHFAKPALKSALEQYKFHVHALSLLDFKKPASFIKAAEEEIARLNPKKKEDVIRIERMWGMVDERKKTLSSQNKHWKERAEELGHLIAYIANNLVMIRDLCEKSIKCLVSEQIDRTKELSLIEDIKTHYKERLRDALHQGTISKEQLEIAKEEVAELSKRTADLLRSDVYTMTQLYETIHSHAGNTVNELNAVVEALTKKNHASFDEDLKLFVQAERLLLSFVSDCRFDRGILELDTQTTQGALLAEKRKEIFSHLVNLLPNSV